MRICNYYHANPQIILSSATIANPEEHAKRLTGKDFEIVSNDGAPRGKKSFVFWNPPFIDATNTIRRSTHQETKDLLTLNIIKNLQTLCFTTSRQMAELITRWTKEELKARSPKLPNISNSLSRRLSSPGTTRHRKSTKKQKLNRRSLNQRVGTGNRYWLFGFSDNFWLPRNSHFYLAASRTSRQNQL